MEQRTISPALVFIYKLLGPLEKILIVIVLTGGALKYLHLPGGNEILMLSMSALAAVFYLLGFRPPEPVEGGDRKKGFSDLLAATILPKLGMIGCSVVTIGALFALLHLNGAGEMLLIGSTALGAVSILIIYFMATGSLYTPTLMNIIYRAAPLCLLGWYMLMNLPPVVK